MSAAPMSWKRGRGKLGVMTPLLGTWRAEAETEMGKVVCVRSYEKVLAGAYVQLKADWRFADRSYNEIALIGVGEDGQVRFWSFTSDKKQSTGWLADVTDLHPKAIGFEAEMPGGRGRMAYWPHEREGFVWVVESASKKGWTRFVEHHYSAVD
ncbi:MAG: hypothetical protein KKA32_14585 [Actinobacteria bacterium]|nr:hypothetical protein [Actinomycetota bacterium]